MTQPVVPPVTPAANTHTSSGSSGPAALPASHVSPFTQRAVDLAVPKPKAPPPPAAGTEQVVDTAPPSAGAAAPATPVGVTPPATVADKVREAEERAARLVARRQAEKRTESEAQAQARYYQQQAAQYQQQAAVAQAAAERVDKDTLTVMREKGITDKMVAQAHIDDSTPEGRIAKLERELKARDARDAERDRQAQVQFAQADLSRKEQHFVQAIEGIKESDKPDAPLMYPYLAARARVAPMLVLAEAKQIIADEMARQAREVPPHLRRVPTNKDVYDYQEWCMVQAEAARLAATGAPPGPGTASPKTPQPAAAPPTRNGGTRTLSSRSTAPAVIAKPFGKMSRTEQIAHMAAQLKAVTPE